ncbi:hypothetical protein [Cupriavidus sp. BIC8F]|nr:hypothetical protein [Cupriavidus sp. BIC8F]
MRTGTIYLSCITAILVAGAVALVVLPTMTELHRALTAALAVAR